ncbi:MAG TPA: ABC-2 transporter permease [Candidatus Avimonas sp.]|nr:ABC-2 transporter permease [Clostridiales bacterium]HPU58779.1 ABC-2 transporter permease [Candidatus Avimonas sp.]
MKGLILKDIYTLIKQTRIILLLVIFFSITPGYSGASFAVVYGAMLPITALAYDERCKWNTLAAMMPYSARDMVLSKYLLGYITVGSATLLTVTAQTFIALFRNSDSAANDILSILFVALTGTVVLAVNLPIVFKMGVEKGRYIFMFLIAVFTIAVTAFGSRLGEIILNINISPWGFGICLLLAAVVLNVVSILISVKIFSKKAE